MSINIPSIKIKKKSYISLQQLEYSMSMGGIGAVIGGFVAGGAVSGRAEDAGAVAGGSAGWGVSEDGRGMGGGGGCSW